MRLWLLIFMFLCLDLGAQLQGTWRVVRYFSLEIDPLTNQLESREVNFPSQIFLLMTGREIQIPPLVPERIPYVKISQYSFLFKISNQQYRGVLLDDMLYVLIEGFGRERTSTGSGYYCFYLEPYTHR